MIERCKEGKHSVRGQFTQYLIKSTVAKSRPQFIKPTIAKNEVAMCRLDDSDSFEASDNDNELNSIPSKHSPHKSTASPRFELDMRNQGLLENIKHIQRLNYHLNKKFGAAEKLTRDNSHNSLGNRKLYAFPFQKRVRSKSPIRASLECAESSANKPLVVTKNFLVAASRRGAELCGLSTGPTDEEKKEVWMYKRIAADKPREANDVEAVSYTHLTLPTICSV
eukprot:TRINITY_DN10299_c0_g2_i1.p1 TRINITY_DN10299_c0_g2~~TRINITY_DN10299_c0_g2_i1.p1  ORF type:complete len:223 (-),score=49.73 TRINITY_DN10299_c0_g2_i1:46-714(-)